MTPGPIPTLSKLPLEIATARLQLRPARPEDAEPLFRYASDPEVARYVTWSAHQSIDETRGFIAWAASNVDKSMNIVWIIEHAGEPIGAIGLHGIRWGLRAIRVDHAELGYWIGRAHWGKGLVSEAARAVVDWGFSTCGLHKINVMCLEQNAGSRRVIEKLGARFVGRAAADVWRDGAWHAHLKYEMIAP
jgi:ribosomal-protein-alanine N-acetyltransferase